MKKTLLLFTLCYLHYGLYAQWSDTNNKFYDTLLMPVTSIAGDQVNPIVVRSYPDEGYFVIWQDYRNGDKDIYAQKYSKSGKALWIASGVPVATGGGDQFYDAGDYRNYSHACTDSTGGFYIAFENGINTGLHSSYIQHIKSTGKRVFSGIGSLLLQSNYYSIVNPQLIADGNKGFYVGYLTIGNFGEKNLYLFDYRDNNGTLKSFGGGQMNNTGVNKQQSSDCGIQNYIDYITLPVDGYMIYPDKQGGCNIVMNFEINSGTGENAYVGFNRLCRVKKNCTATIQRRVNDIAKTKKVVIHYPKDSVVRLYQLTTFSNTVICGSAGSTTSVTSYYVENGGEGYLLISDHYYNVGNTKGTIASTTGKISADVIGFDARKLSGNSVTDYHIHAITIPEEIYDSIPYQLTSNAAKPYYAYNPIWPAGYPKLGHFNDTILNSLSGSEFSLTTAKNRIFASCITGEGNVMLQELDAVKVNTDSFAIKVKTTNKNGVIIGRNVFTGYAGTGISWSDPYVAGDDKGNAVFCITDNGRSVRVSPVGSNAQLQWGAMGRPTGSLGSSSLGSLLMDPSDATGLVAFHKPDNGQDIFMRHLDNLNSTGYPPTIKITRLNNFYNQGAPGIMLGTSNALSLFEISDSRGLSTPIFELPDIFNLGAVQSSIFEESLVYPQRSYNGRYYLGRNYSIVPDSTPSATTFKLRFYFTKAEFDSIKAVAGSVTSPLDLVAIQQPTNSGAYEYYSPVTGEKTLTPSAMATVPGGYYLEFKTKKFGNFFLFEKGSSLIKQNIIAATIKANDFIKRVYPTDIRQDQLHIETGEMKLNSMLVELYSIDGKLLWQRELLYHAQTIQLALPSGLYNIRIASGSNVFETKVFNSK